MKKKVFASITALIMMFSILASIPVIADDETKEIGGLEFHSMTIHYNGTIQTGYYTKQNVKYEKPDGKTGTKTVNYFFNPDAENEDEKYTTSKGVPITATQNVITAGNKTSGNFYQLKADSYNDELFYSKIPYTNAFITHIVNGSGITTTSSINMFGITKIYDDAPYEHKNPIYSYNNDGYAIAEEKNKDGNNKLIDVNGYLFDPDNYIWLSSEGERIELFTFVPVLRKTAEKKNGSFQIDVVETQELEWVPVNDRFDSNGKIKDIKDIFQYYTISKEEYDAFKDDENQKELKLKRVSTLEEYKNGASKAKMISYVKSFVIAKPENADESYMSLDTVFTGNDVKKDKKGNLALGTPVIGTPVMNVQIEKITLEIDALGTQLYDDVASDPQQKNVITVSINDCAKNANILNQWLKDGSISEKQYNSYETFILGTAKSVTTKTSVSLTKGDYDSKTGYSPTTKSIELQLTDAEILKKMPRTCFIYIDFEINEQQPEAAYNEDYIKKMIAFASDKKSSTLLTNNVKIFTDADMPTPEPSGYEYVTTFPTWAIVAIIAGAVIVIAVVVIVIILTSKKKKSAK